MSDRIDWIIPSGIDNPGWIIPAAVWSTGVAFQFVSAAREWWSNREARQRRRQWETSDWVKVIRGEVKRGFRLWLEPRCCPYSRIKCHYSMRSRVVNNGNYREEDEMASVCMTINHRMPNNADRCSTMLRRYSIFSPSVYTDVVEVISQIESTGWAPLKDIQLDDRTVASIFKRVSSDRICVILADIKEKSSQVLKITSPPGISTVLFMCRDEQRPNRVRIVYGVQEWNRQEIITVDYEIHPSNNVDPSRLIAREVASQSITIPGQREYKSIVFPGTCRLQSNHPNVQSLVLVFDHRGNFQGDSHDNWRRNFQASVLGRQWSKALEDFDSLWPEIQHARTLYPLLRGELVHGKFNGVFAQRHLNVPSMKFLAADAICRGAKPGADMSMIKAETGIDIFDGIIESREKPTPTIRLIPNDEDGL